MNDMKCVDIESVMSDALFGTIDTVGQEALDRHLASSPSCSATFAELRKAVQLAAAAPVPEMPDPYWNSYYDRLLKRMHAEDAAPSPGSFRRSILDMLSARLSGVPSWSLQVGFAIVLLATGVLIGRNWQAAPPISDGASNTPAAGEARLMPAVLSARTERYLDRSSVLLLGLVNVDLSHDDAGMLRLDRKQALAGELVHEAGLLKSELEKMQEQQLTQLVEDLEKILRQIANLEAQQDLPSIELIQRGVDRGDLLFKINLEKMKMADQEARHGL